MQAQLPTILQCRRRVYSAPRNTPHPQSETSRVLLSQCGSIQKSFLHSEAI
ncbi:hypothetical protein HMPREF0742_01945 [Rothia aeria F0184]|uniref:Uncharacterized protein n=1 Tax=Rothia aeria F0184 TaxID=888019 RepID=U7V1T9_9MICC|nr:hypothetical protein HMPREF0742_01945 [Rothia aeria F0184]